MQATNDGDWQLNREEQFEDPHQDRSPAKPEKRNTGGQESPDADQDEFYTFVFRL
jgi:hypothetical protein